MRKTSNIPPVFRELSLIGGHPALDFLNTVKYRGEADPRDRLESYSDAIEWAEVAGLLSTAEAKRLSRQATKTASANSLRREICEFREAVRVLFATKHQNVARTTRAILRVEAEISALRPVATIDRKSGALTKEIVISDAGDLKAKIVSAVAELLLLRTELRIKTCRGFDCDWVFIDRTKAGRRQWCDTRTCGNIARVRRYRERH